MTEAIADDAMEGRETGRVEGGKGGGQRVVSTSSHRMTVMAFQTRSKVDDSLTVGTRGMACSTELRGLLRSWMNDAT